MSIVLKRVEKSPYTFRPHWSVNKVQNPGFAVKDRDLAYRHLKDSNLSADWLCEIGSDIGRSTAWLSNIAQNIDVYEQDTSYIEICKQQCYRHQQHYVPIRNVNWFEVEDISITQVLETLPKHYDAIKLQTVGVAQYVPLMLQKLKPNGFLLLKEYGSQTEKQELVQMLQYQYNMTLSRHELQLFVAKHK